jgi:hypothetical protein
VTHVEAVPAQLYPQGIGQGGEPAFVDVRRLLKGVVIADFGKIIISRVKG